MIKYTNYYLTLLFLSLFIWGNAQSNANKFRVFVGVGDNNLVADAITLSDKSFLGELSGQLRLGIRFYDNYEINFGVYGRKYPGISNYPGVTYNKFMGYSGGITYEFRKPESRWGIPFGMEVLKYNRNLDSSLGDGSKYYDHYKAFSYGPKIGIRCHLSKYFFIEAEANILYEEFKSEVLWGEDKLDYSLIEANSFGSFKFLGISSNLSF
ncbi:MAG: hypothetical protein ACKVQB_00935 [Bacteroidia bacterium]